MPDFTALKSKLGDWIGADTTRLPDSVRGDLLNMAIREILRDNDLRFNETSAAINTVAGTPNYATPTRFSRPLLAYYENSSGSRVDLVQISREEYVDKYALSDDTSPPEHYSVFGSVIYLGPTPDAVYGISMEYYQTLADLSAGSDTNAMTDNAWEAVLFLALQNAAIYLVEDGRAPAFESLYQKALHQLLREHARSRTAGRRPVSNEIG